MSRLVHDPAVQDVLGQLRTLYDWCQQPPQVALCWPVALGLMMTINGALAMATVLENPHGAPWGPR